MLRGGQAASPYLKVFFGELGGRAVLARGLAVPSVALWTLNPHFGRAERCAGSFPFGVTSLPTAIAVAASR